MYTIEKLPTAKSEIPLAKCMQDNVIPRFPFSWTISGRSGSGKTNLLLNILTNETLLKNYFHGVLIISPTAAEGDDTYDILKLDKSCFIKDISPEFLETLINSRKKLIKSKGIKWVSNNHRVLLILDDIIANRGFLESPQCLKMFALLRHYLVSVIVLMQSYNKLPRAIRINANAISVFPCLESERRVLIDEICPSGVSKRDFGKMIDKATEGKYDFLHINNHAPRGERIRKNLNEILLVETKNDY